MISPNPETVSSSPVTAPCAGLAGGEVPGHQRHHGDQGQGQQYHVDQEDDLRRVGTVAVISISISTHFSPSLLSVVATVPASRTEQHHQDRDDEKLNRQGASLAEGSAGLYSIVERDGNQLSSH